MLAFRMQRDFGVQWSPLLITLPIIIYTLWSQNLLLARGEQAIAQNITEVKNATKPLIYKRLRFDRDFLQVYRRFQKTLTIDETRVTFKVNETQTDNKTKLVDYSYYENNKIEAASLTQDDIIFEALDQTYMTRLQPAYVYTFDNKRNLAEASDPSLVSRRRCDKELDFLLHQLDVMTNVRQNGARTGLQLNNTLSLDVLALFDAFGQEEPGLILGNYVWSGNWRQCQKSLIFSPDSADPSNSLQFKSRYCIASIRSKRWDEIAAQRVPELEKRRHFKYPEQKYDYARFHRIQVGLCLPESCDSTLFERRARDLHRLVVHKLSEPLRSYDLKDLYCLPDETSKMRELEPAGRLFMLFTTLWLAIMISATFYDYHRGPSGPTKPVSFMEKMVDAMSITRNFARLTETKSCQSAPPKQVTISATTTTISADAVKQSGRVKLASERNKPAVNDLLFLNCIKVFTTPTIILGHGGMMFKHLDRFVLDYDCISKWLAHFGFSAVFFVDWYFVITGFLTTYVMFVTRRVERNNLAAWTHTIVHRYLRLAPLYLLLFWFAKSVFKYTSHGPIWDYGTNNMTLRAICQRESFIYPLTLTSNFHPIHDECIMPSWYISCDFQFYLITPFLLILLNKSPLAGWLTSLGAIGACIALRLHRYLTDPRAKPLDLMRPRYDLYMRNNWDMHPTYIYPHYRIASYLIGVLAGHYTYMVLSGQWQSPLYYDRAATGGKAKSNRSEAAIKRRKDLCRLGVCLFGLTVLVSMMFVTGIISYLPQFLEPHVRYVTASTYSISHSGASLAMSLVLIAMMFGQFAELKRAMSWPIWTVISRVGFIVYLSQIEVIYWTTQSSDRLNELNNLELFKGFCYLSAILYPLSTLLTLVFELPFAQLERNFVAPLFQTAVAAASHQTAALLPPTSPPPARRNNTAVNATGNEPKQESRRSDCELATMQPTGGK